jgi:hypothetical protein
MVIQRKSVQPRCNLVAWTVAAMAFGPLTSRAEPWVGPGDIALRHDLQQLADAGVLQEPTLSWPLPWAGISADVAEVDVARLSLQLQSALSRVEARAAAETAGQEIGVEMAIAGTSDPWALRSFEDGPREKGELSVAVDQAGDRLSWKLSAGVAGNPHDEQEFRLDGSYVAVRLGNWNLSAGAIDRWWGPGWEGSLILSSNTRPMPSIALDRNEARTFSWPVLRWLGPWRLSTFMGQLEEDRDYPHALLFGIRAEARPIPSLQVAASRTAQWCGEGRPCGLGTFGDLLAGNDNSDDLATEPGNQMGGFDVRWSWPAGRVPMALYAQAIGEDEAGFLPSRYLGLFGAETWGEWRGKTWRLHLEYADTACDFPASPPDFGCAYTHHIYTSGYRYRGRAIGHTIDADGESAGMGVLWMAGSGRYWNLLVRDVKLNRAGLATGHSLVGGPANVNDVSLTHGRPLAWGNITAQLGYADVASTGTERPVDGFRASLTWRYEIR